MAVIRVPTQVVRMKMKTRESMRSFLESQVSLLELIENNIIVSVKVKEAGLSERFVRIAEVPFETDESKSQN